MEEGVHGGGENDYSGLRNQKSQIGKMLKEIGQSQKEEGKKGNAQTVYPHLYLNPELR